MSGAPQGTSLHQMHATASRSDALTTFDDLTAPPAPSSVGEPKAIELVHGGLSGLYSRIKASVGVKDPALDGTDDSVVAGSRNKAPPKTAGNTKSPAGTAVSSPVVVSLPSSRLQSPLVTSFPDPHQQPPPSRDSNISSATLSSKVSGNGSKSSLATTRSRPSITPSVDPTKRDDNSYTQSPASTSSKALNNATFESATRGQSTSSLARKQKGDMDLRDQESDTTEDDLVLVDNGGLPTDNVKPSYPSEAARDTLTKVNSRNESQLNPGPSALKHARESSDNGSVSTEVPRLTASAQTPVLAPAPQRPPLVSVGPSHLPGFRPSRASSSDGVSSVITTSTIRTPAIAPIEELNRQAQGRPPPGNLPNNAFSQMRRKILDKEFWMRDENAKDCFYCGDAFSTFRRKHHCRTCGQIFDAKCTSLVSGKIFGQSGNLRVCKPCEAIIHGNDDDSSDYTDDGDQASIYEQTSLANDLDSEPFQPSESDHTKISTPTISIPMSRKQGSEKKRRSAVIEVAPPTLARPSSSRSLRSLSGRPRSSSHKRHHSRHQHMRNMKNEDKAPFHQSEMDGFRSRSALPAFHHDNIIDPDLAPFMSDEGSSEDEPASIFATLGAETSAHASMESEKSGLAGLLAAMRKGKSRPGDKSVTGTSHHARDADNISITSRHANRHTRRRNLSVSSITHRPSPRRTKSNTLLRPFTSGFGASAPQPVTPQFHPSPSPTPPGSRITRSASIYALQSHQRVELDNAYKAHVHKLLKQMLHDSGIRHPSSWEKALVPILLQCADDVSPNMHIGDDMDIRNYIKLKKIPGGKPRDTAYVPGVVFTKNVALRSMPRSISNPRILIVTFAIEYARHQTHFMSLEPVIAQEREYLRNLVSRIAALRPHVLLVQRHVSGLALEFLEQEGITVVYNVKATVLNAVARCTQSRMISSVDKLAIDPAHLGQCGNFDVKTYVHKNTRKTYIFLSGCQPDLGCTIVLRGAGDQDLTKLKRITEFMTYVVYNLKLEICLMRDESICIPAESPGGTLISSPETEEHKKKELRAGTDSDGTENEGGDPSPSYYSDLVENHRTQILSASPFVKFMQPYLLNQAREYESKLGHLTKLMEQYTTEDENEKVEEENTQEDFKLVQPEMVHNVVEQASKQVREFLQAVHKTEYDKALHNYQTQKRQWEAYLAGNADLYDPFNHQKIAVLYSVVNTFTSTPCIGPEIIALGFYQEHDYEDGLTPDCPLGQYVEDLCSAAAVPCGANGCNKRMIDHSRQYVHGEGQMSVILQKHSPKIKGVDRTICMWSCCRICGKETQAMPISDWTWKYSFAKYLELTFWSSPLHTQSDICPHDIHKNHARYFGYNNIALRIQYDPVPLYEVVVPRPNVTWNVDSDLRLKNEQYMKIEERLDHFMASVRLRIRGIHVESVIPEKVEECRKEVEELMTRANEEHAWLLAKLQDKYMNAKYYEIIPLNRAIRAIQEKAIAWDDTFTEFEQQYFPSEKDIRRLATLQLKKIFLERDESQSSLTSVEEGAESGTEDSAANEKSDPVALTPMPSSMSPEKARDMLTSVVREDQSSGAKPANDNDESQPEQPLASPKDFPIQKTPLEALERDDVRHLDLAVSSNFPDEQHMKTPTMPPESGLPEPPESPTPLAVPRVNPIDKSVVDAIDSMVASPLSQPTSATLESKIPRLVDTIRRETPQRPAALIRTQSQPGGVSKPQGSPGIPSAPPTEIPRPSLLESSKTFERMSERLGLGTFKQTKTSKIPRSVPFKSAKEASRVSKLAEHFEQLSREFQKERMRERRNERNRQARAYPLASSRPIVEVYRDVHEAVQESHPSDEDAPRMSTDNSTLGDSQFTETTGITTNSQSPVDERHPPDLTTLRPENEGQPPTPGHLASDAESETGDVEISPEDVPLPDSIASSQLLNMSDSQLGESLELPKHEKTTLMKMLTSFWSERSASGWAPLDYPFAPIEHVWEDSDIIVREDEPSSIIALALSSPDYLNKLRSFRDDPRFSERGDMKPESLEDSIERNLLHEKNTNIRYGFMNRGVRAQCKIFYAQSFDALRRKCGVADRFVESLARCSKWDSKGGKSKSIFLKTLDDRFVLKSLSPIEVQAFFRFAPNYFAFTHQNLFKQLPSVIAKMFGLFQVQIKTPTGRDFDWFMLVMENLFYDREPNRRYDLKGSMRNRKIESTGERDEVLLDENLVDIIYSETPIFVREHTKKLLKASVWNDTLFLSQNNVMDYSLMAGFDDTNREIIVGIIDCIRTYTWDKKLESWIKDRGKNKPTITSPRDYRNRFRIAMEKYILQAPNCWHQFSGRVVGVDVQRRRLPNITPQGQVIGGDNPSAADVGVRNGVERMVDIDGGDMERGV